MTFHLGLVCIIQIGKAMTKAARKTEENSKLHGEEPSFLYVQHILDKCCTNRYGWNKDSCLGAGGPTLPTGSNKWYLNSYENDSICVQDCEGTTAPCGGLANSWDTLHDSAKDCCQKKLSWITVSKCEAESTGGTAAGSDQWYVDWENETCVKDCVGGAPCGGLAEKWNFLYSSVIKCCDEIPWEKKCGQ